MRSAAHEISRACLFQSGLHANHEFLITRGFTYLDVEDHVRTHVVSPIFFGLWRRCRLPQDHLPILISSIWSFFETSRKRDGGPESTGPPSRRYLLSFERSARRIEIRVVIADPRGVVAAVEIRAIDRRARGSESGFLHLVVAAAIVPERVGGLVRSSFFLREERAGEGCRHECDSAESSDHD